MASGWNDTPLTPVDEVYYALKTIVDKNNGVADTSKVWLQISFDWVGWQKKEGKIINKDALSLGYNTFKQILAGGADIKYSQYSMNPYVKYINAADGIENIIWYEDSRSVMAKIRLAQMFGINGISLWRLGNIPADESPSDKQQYLDVWQNIVKNKAGH